MIMPRKRQSLFLLMRLGARKRKWSIRLFVLLVLCFIFVSVILINIVHVRDLERQLIPKQLITVINQTIDTTDMTAWSILPSSIKTEVRHIVFLKVHKAAGTTLMNVIMRFAMNRNLSIMLPRTGNMFSQYNKLVPRKALPSFYKDKRMFDVFCNHVIYSKELMAPFFPSDTIYVGIVREPFQQFVSAFMYYRNLYDVKYLLKIPGENPIQTYLSDPLKYEAKKLHFSYTNNRMSFDFGYPGSDFNDMKKFKAYLNKLDQELHLVLVVELFDESLIIMKRMLKWHLKDILYLKRNSNNNLYKHLNFTESDKWIHKRWAKLDYALYDHFRSVLIKKLKAAGPNFQEEVGNFQKCLKKVGKYCDEFYNKGSLLVDGSDYNSPFLITKRDCEFFKLDAFGIIKKARQKHTERLDELGIIYCPENKTSLECKKYPRL